ncbi:hypothetical protein BMF94_3154 [Rhodotorula taiwanensis]|uniref:Uncharacterized protein n=1 Tax=Rhodotorula taiwanensis TaxID=741276 RepID=A0A2S5BA11_9BASI|nr:hypothetical protein BMF94_3154 [Rhodotorula taiwanensis]
MQPYQPGHVRRRSSSSAPSSSSLRLPPLKLPIPPPSSPRLGTAVQHRRALIRTALLGAVAFATLAAFLLLPQQCITVPADIVLPAAGPSTAARKPSLHEAAMVPPKRPRPHQAAKIQHQAEAEVVMEPSAGAGTAEPPVKERPSKLPVCEKSAVFRFAGLHGFGSEVTLMYRMAAVASHFGYEVFLDDARWNYGTWLDYFRPLALPSSSTGISTALPTVTRCSMPKEGTKRAKVVLTADELRSLSGSLATDAPFTPRWTARSHVLWSTRDMDGLDLTYLHLFTNSSDLETLRRADLELAADAAPLFLTPEQTLPPAYEGAFSQSSGIAGRAWQLDEGLLQAVEGMRSAIGVSGDLPQDGIGAPTLHPSDLVIALHVRLGDKFLEIDRVKGGHATAETTDHDATPGLTDELVAAYYAAATDSVHSLAGLSRRDDDESTAIEPRWNVASGGDAHASEDVAAPNDRPLLVLMSDDPTAVDVFRGHALAKWFRIKSTVEVGAAVSPGNEPTGGVSEGKPSRAKRLRRSHPDPIPAGFNEIEFNRLPLATRIENTRVFVRDLTFLARTADALVITGSSNVGRLLMMLFEAQGKAAMRRNEVADERGPGEPIGGDGFARPPARREMRSLDTRWFPTARYT